MDQKSARRLRILGLCVLALFFLFAFPATTVMGGMAEPYKEALATTLAFGIGLLLVAEIGPLVKSLKAGGVEVEFVESLGGKFNEFETRLAQLEWAAAHPELTAKEVRAREIEPAPARQRKLRRRDDQWKGRFGGAAESGGFRLSAEFAKVGKDLVQVFLTVSAPEDSELQNLECVEFYLHETFKPCVVPAVFHDGEAKLSILAYGGFTAGVWIPCAKVELELDLAEIPNAPQIIREN